MNWVLSTFSTSVGKKQVMAVTGMLFLLFLAVHLLGNLTLVGGPAAFNAYSDRLHALGALLAAAEIVMVLAALLHVGLGLVLFLENRRARPVSYAMDKSGGGGRTLSSQTMPYSGFLILAFLVFHLSTFSRFFADRAGRDNFQVVAEVFARPAYRAVYVVAMVIVALHVRHGLWSAFQTLGANHPKYMHCLEKLSIVFAVVVAVGFGALPLAVSLLR